ncbi:calmin isoform X2 [Hemicordylus capensis]|uniref:calmin isoform X2 n=1 Tax=Hemicordylus capensis TaxID=884348 RepID=UPI0023044D62|nr:calmin isoform X2 [Hemicordylus capensis]
MAGHEWDWFQREELIGQISDIRVQNLQVERENVQKRTFTRWINLHLEKCSPPLEVKDLLTDIKDGKILMALLEVLSGQNLLHEYKPSTHRIFRLNNIAKALKFLEDSNVKLVSIDAAEIADGNSSMVLGLIWNIILFFQIKELTGNLNRNSSSSSLSSGPSGPDSDTSYPSTPNVERSMSVSVKDQRKAIKALLTWVQKKTRKYGVAVQDFASSWRSGLAFLAVIKAIDSNVVDMKQALEKSPRENLEDAFTAAQNHLGIPRLLEPEDIMVESPDEQSIVTYVAQFLEHFPELEGEDFSDLDKEIPVEATYVHVKDIPGQEKQEKILILNENGEHTYTTHLDQSQSPPHKIHILDSAFDHKGQHLHKANEALHDNLHQPLSDLSETFTEEPQRPRSLPITEPIGFPSSSVTDILANKPNRPEGNQLSTSDSLKQNDNLPPTVLTYPRHSIDPVESSGVDSEEPNAQKSTSERTKSPDRKSRSLLRTSHAPKNVPEHLPKEMLGSQDEETTQSYIMQMLHEEISKLPDKDESAKPASELYEMHAAPQDTEESSFEDSSEASCPPEHLIRNTPKSLDVTHEDRSLAAVKSNSSKVSIIPHDLFYYPHYDVPISEVLDAFATPDPDPSLSENNKICAELLVTCLTEKESLTLSNEEGIPQQGQPTNVKGSPAEMDEKGLEKQKKDAPSPTLSSLNSVGVSVAMKNAASKPSAQKDSTHADVPVFDTVAATEERKPLEERSKRKEKRKNKTIYQGENTQSSKAGSTRLIDKLEEEYIDHQGLSRLSHSDPNVVFQRNCPEPTSKERGSTDEQKSTATSESSNPSARKRKDAERREDPGTVAPRNSTSRTDQPELFYFIVFLWVLVYCLLLLPQLVSSPL